MEAVQDVIYVLRLSPNFAFEFISDSVTELVGYTPEEHYRDPDLGTRIVDPRDVHRLAAMTQVPPGQRLEVTLRWVNREGRAIWTQHRCIKQTRADGSMVLIGSARDVTEQVRDREALAAAREQYRLIAENASDVVFRGTNDGRLEWISESVVDVIGWSPRELTGRALIDLVHPEDRPLVRQTEEKPQQGASAAFEVRIRTRGGDWRWFAVSMRSVFDAHGTVIGSVGGWRDIQARVLLRNALLSSENLFRTLMQHSTVGAILTDSTARITTVSDTACAILGRSREDLLSRPWSALVDDDEQDAVLVAFDEVAAGRRDNVRCVRRLTRVDGSPLWLDESLSGVRDEHDDVTSCLLQIYDVTEELEARDALQRSREEYRLLAENAADIVLRLGSQAEATWISPSATRLTGHETDDVIGRSVLEFVHPADTTRAQAALSRLYDAHAETATEELRIRHRDDSYAWWQATARLTGQDQVVLTLRNIESEVIARQSAALEESRRAAAVQSMLDPHLLLVAVREETSMITDFRIADANDAACIAFSLDRDQLVGTALSGHAERVSEFGLFEQLKETLTSGDALLIDGARLTNTDSESYLDVRAVRVGSEALSLTWRDVTDRHQLLVQLADSRARYRSIMQSELEPHITMVAVRDESGAIVDFRYKEANPAALTYLGLTRDAFSRTTVREMYPSAAAAHLLNMYAHTVETGEPLIADDYSYPNEMFAGQTRWYDLRGAKLGDGLSLAWRDVTERHEAADRLADSEKRYRLLAENAAHVVFRLDQHGLFSFCSDGVRLGLGLSPSDLLGSALRDLVHPEDIRVLHEITEEAASELFGPAQLRLRTGDGAYRWAELTGRRVPDGAGLVGGWRDVTTEVHAQQALEAKARHDDLTGLFNRSEIRTQLHQMLQRGSKVSVLYVDLDNLKDINDTHGHAAGDRALLVTTQRILGRLRDGDLAGRIGGDEFLLLLSEDRDPLATAHDILSTVEAVIPSDTGPLTSTVSIGLAKRSPADTVDALIARADRAMYQAKTAGRNQVVALDASPSISRS